MEELPPCKASNDLCAWIIRCPSLCVCVCARVAESISEGEGSCPASARRTENIQQHDGSPSKQTSTDQRNSNERRQFEGRVANFLGT